MEQIKLLKNARIYPNGTNNEVITCLAIRNARIIDAGNASIESQWEDQADHMFDLGGRVVLPGITDAHIHLEKYSLSLNQVDCETETIEECLARLTAAVDNAPPGTWVRGHGWDQNKWGRFGTLAEIDAAAPDNPVYLTAKSLHAAWVNSLALNECSIHSPVEQVDGGRIDTQDNGNPTGLLFEEAMQLVSENIPRHTSEQIRSSIHDAQHKLLRYGITAVHDFDGARCFRALQELHRHGNLHIRVVKNIQRKQLDAAHSTGLQTGFGDDWLRIGHLKLFADGALGPQTAAMLEPYNSQSDNTGILLLDQDEIVEIGTRALEAGFPLTVHAIGDRASREVIRAFAALEQQAATAFPPPRIEHLQVIHPADLEDLAGARVTISMQPLHAPSDRPTAARYWGKRTRWSYAWNAVGQTGSLLIFGSDAPVESPDPFLGIYAAVTRKLKSDDQDSPSWIPEERIDLATALQAYTINPPIAAGIGSQLGQLQAGYLADLILLDRDPFERPSSDLPDTKVLGAMTGGEWRFLDI